MILKTIIMYACVAALLVMAAVVLGCVCRRALSVLRRVLNPVELCAFVLVAGACTWAAQKHLVRFPRTDPAQSYLTDAGSWVDSETDVVHIDFNRIIVPDSAMLYVDRVERTDGAEYVTHLMTTIGEAHPPIEFVHPNATNFEWIVYTDWTPGPAVQTNGVWHANWGRDTRRRFIIPVRTAVRVDGEVIATPKSKEDANVHQ